MNKIIIAIISVLVGALVFVASLPLFDSLTITTNAGDNEGMYNLRYDLVDSHSMFTVVIDYDELNDVLTITNGSDVQTFTGENLEYFYADNNVSVLSADGFIFMVGKNTNNEVSYVNLEEYPITITRTDGGVSIECDGVTYTYGAPTYAYIPFKTGKYATFPDGQEIVTNSSLKDAFFGYYAGVYAYNGMNTQNLALYLNKTYNGDNLTGAKWGKTEPEIVDTPDNLNLTPFDPGSIDFDPIDIDPLDPGNQIMMVPTPTYTDGDWGYELDGDNNATIVSYSGSAGNITVPATVGGYTVTTLGKGGNNQNVFDYSLTDYNVTISDGITKINKYAFFGTTNLKTVTVPGSVTTISSFAFRQSGITNIILSDGLIEICGFNDCPNLLPFVIPDTVTTIASSFIINCPNVTYLVIPDSVETVGYFAFQSNNLTQVLNMSDVDLSNIVYGLSSDVVSNEIGGLVYIGNTSYVVTGHDDGAIYTFISMLPLIAILGLVLTTIAVFIIRKA